MPVDRRTFLRLTAALPVSVSAASCAKRAPTDERIVELLGLGPQDRSWVAALAAEDREHLVTALESRSRDRRAGDMIFRLVEPRDRLFAYVEYPAVSRRRSVCDGLLRE